MKTISFKVASLLGSIALVGIGVTPVHAAVPNTLSGPSSVGLEIPDSQPYKGLAAGTHDQEWYNAANAEIEAFYVAHPLDLAGLEDLVRKYTGQDLAVVVNDVAEPLTGAEAQEIMDERAVAPSVSESARAVPTNAFTVSFSWVPILGTGENEWQAHGTWNFRDDFVNGSDPDDVASNMLDLGGSCWKIQSSNWRTYRYDGVETTGTSYLENSGVSSGAPILRIRDAATNFTLNVDHGQFNTHVRANCGPTTVRGSFAYEHNQDYNSLGISVSASFGVLSVSYSGSGGSRIQKSTGIASHTG